VASIGLQPRSWQIASIPSSGLRKIGTANVKKIREHEVLNIDHRGPLCHAKRAMYEEKQQYA
jgi:hypothetical protein